MIIFEKTGYKFLGNKSKYTMLIVKDEEGFYFYVLENYIDKTYAAFVRSVIFAYYYYYESDTFKITKGVKFNIIKHFFIVLLAFLSIPRYK